MAVDLSRNKFQLAIGLFVIGIAISAIVSTTIGQASISFSECLQILASKLLKYDDLTAIPRGHLEIIWNIRFPRALLAILVGASLAIVGALLQSVTGNPLADPHILGISSGASIGAVIVIVFQSNLLPGNFSISVTAFIFGLITFLIVLGIARVGGQLSSLRIILAGVAVSYICTAITSLLILRSNDIEAVQSIQFWLLGSLSNAGWEHLGLLLVITLSTISYSLFQSHSLNALLLGEEDAATLGINIGQLKKTVILVAAFNIGSVVAVSGSIAFVGLLVPHMVRMILGVDHRKVLVFTAMTGGLFMLWADLAARSIAKPEELPLGIITSLIGGPFFIWLMIRKGKALH